MFRFTLCAYCSLVCAPCFAGDHDPTEIDFGPGLMWRYISVWEDDPESSIAYWVQGFRDSGVYTSAHFSYRTIDGIVVRAPSFTLRATNLNDVDRLDTDGDFDIDVDDLNIVRNEFGEPSFHDITGDGMLGLEDLNKVRNEFGLKLFTIGAPPWQPEEFEFGTGGEFSIWVTGEVLDSCATINDGRFGPAVTPCADANPIPEPSTIVIAAIAIMALSPRFLSMFRRSP